MCRSIKSRSWCKICILLERLRTGRPQKTHWTVVKFINDEIRQATFVFLLRLFQIITAVLLSVLDEWEDTGEKMRTELEDSWLQASLTDQNNSFLLSAAVQCDHLFVFFHGWLCESWLFYILKHLIARASWLLNCIAYTALITTFLYIYNLEIKKTKKLKHCLHQKKQLLFWCELKLQKYGNTCSLLDN